LIKGKKYLEIENKVNEDNLPSFSYIEEIIKEYSDV